MREDPVESTQEGHGGGWFGWALCLTPPGTWALHLAWPDVFLLKLLAIVTVLMVAAVLVDFGCQHFSGARTYTLHFDCFSVTVLLGAVLGVFYGWTSTAILLTVLVTWGGIGVWIDRRSSASP